jgi:hypothetical protein
MDGKDQNLTMINEKWLRLRLLVGYLGEKGQFAWWPSAFLDPSAMAFLSPSFPRTQRLAQYHGVIEAARRVHDEFIGVGGVYHLFRLPEELEHALHDAFGTQDPSPWFEGTMSGEMALGKLLAISGGALGLGEGPKTIGRDEAISDPASIRKIAGAYNAAFLAGHRSYPYFKAK